MNEPDDEHARAWKKAVDANKPAERRKVIANVAGVLAMLAVLAMVIPLTMWVVEKNIYVGRGRSLGLYVGVGGFFLAVVAFGTVRAVIDARYSR